MKRLEEIMEHGSREEKMNVSMGIRKAYQMITDKYGTMLDYARTHPTMDEMNNEIVRRDTLMYRYVRMYAQLQH